ncbi:putative 28S rRNA (cytosine-C(5))-methyltransferase, partial [Kappamyces sp. JEL0680]
MSQKPTHNFYVTASGILDKLLRQKGTIKGLVMAEQTVDKKLLYALVCETLKYRQVIDEIIVASGIGKIEKQLPKPLLMLLLYDFLFGRGVRSSLYRPRILKHKARLQAELAKIKIKRKCRENSELIPEHIRNAVVIPRWIRVNVHKTTLEAVVDHFVSQGFVLGDFDDTLALDSHPPKTMCIDKHLPNMLLLPPNADLHKDPLLLDGRIILQDKASCFPAFVLDPPKHAVVIDGCAAPGNKTSHLSAIMENTGTIYAFDMDRKRLDTL